MLKTFPSVEYDSFSAAQIINVLCTIGKNVRYVLHCTNSSNHVLYFTLGREDRVLAGKVMVIKRSTNAVLNLPAPRSVRSGGIQLSTNDKTTTNIDGHTMCVTSKSGKTENEKLQQKYNNFLFWWNLIVPCTLFFSFWMVPRSGPFFWFQIHRRRRSNYHNLECVAHPELR